MEYFVFGSNESGIHGAGAARFAELNYGAVRGVGFGPVGRSFAIPTKDWQIQTLPLNVVKNYISRFLAFAELCDTDTFKLTRIGCGLAGFTEAEIAPLFADAPPNVWLIDDNGEYECAAHEWHVQLDFIESTKK